MFITLDLQKSRKTSYSWNSQVTPTILPFFVVRGICILLLKFEKYWYILTDVTDYTGKRLDWSERGTCLRHKIKAPKISVIKIKNYVNAILFKIKNAKSMTNIVSKLEINKNRISITDFSFGLRLRFHGPAWHRVT